MLITSTDSRDNSGPTTWSDESAIAVGTRGVTIAIDDPDSRGNQKTLVAGEQWQIDVTQTGGGGGAQISVTTPGGVDDSGPTDVTAFDTPFSVGTLGVTISFTDGGDGVLTLGDTWTIDTTAAIPGDGLTLGDTWTIDVTAGGTCAPTCVEPDYVAFCLACHDGNPPPDVAPLLDANMIDVATQYWTKDQHGSIAGNTGSQVSKGHKKLPWTTQAQYDAGDEPAEPYAALQCTSCHDGHGSDNLYHLKTQITVAGIDLSVGGVSGGSFAPGWAQHGSSTYSLPLVGGVQQDHYWGAWCTFCHTMATHPVQVEGDACQSGHMHGGGNF